MNHALDAIDEIEAFVQNVNFEDFELNTMMVSACLHKLEVIGEACNRVGKEIRDSNPQIPWPQIIGLRNMIAHEYFGIDLRTVWNIITLELPILKTQLFTIKESLNPSV